MRAGSWIQFGYVWIGGVYSTPWIEKSKRIGCALVETCHPAAQRLHVLPDLRRLGLRLFVPIVLVRAGLVLRAHLRAA